MRRGTRSRRPLRLRGLALGLPMEFQNLLYELKDGVAVVTVNRPKVLNALNDATVDELRRLFLSLRHDEAVRAVILTGAGEKAFVAGADLNELALQNPLSGTERSLRGQHVFHLLETMGKPVIAGTRVTVELILEKLAAGESAEQILEAHPRISREAIQAALAFAARALKADVVYPTRLTGT